MNEKHYGSIIDNERNRYAITIPKEIVEKLEFYKYDDVEIEIVDGKLVMTLIKA